MCATPIFSKIMRASASFKCLIVGHISLESDGGMVTHGYKTNMSGNRHTYCPTCRLPDMLDSWLVASGWVDTHGWTRLACRWSQGGTSIP